MMKSKDIFVGGKSAAPTSRTLPHFQAISRKATAGVAIWRKTGLAENIWRQAVTIQKSIVDPFIPSAAFGRKRHAGGIVLSLCFCLLLALTGSFLAAGDVAAAWTDNPMLHNSNRFTGTTKWGGNWGTDTGKYGGFDCSTCHVKNSTNIKRVRSSVDTPDGSNWAGPGTPNVTVNFQSVTGPTSFGDDGRADKTQSNLICEVCHSQTSVHRYNSSAGVTDFNHKNANQTDCIICHQHKVGFQPQACDACHGNPPTVNAAQAGDGLAFNPQTTGSSTAGAHGKHAGSGAGQLNLGCNNCHNNYVMPQVSTAKPGFSDISISFSNFGATTGTYSGQSGLSYNNVLGSGGLTCNTVYCHGSTIGGTVNPAWNGAAAACGDCHKGTAAQMASGSPLGSHGKHAGNGASQLNLACSKCHASPGTSGHVTGTVAWDLDRTDALFGGTAAYRGAETGVTAGLAPSAAYGQCSSVYCHSPGQGAAGAVLVAGDYAAPTWGGAATCGSCHKVTEAAGLTSGSHAAHLGTTGVNGCADCHTGAANDASSYVSAQHVDQTIDVAGGYSQGASHAPGNGYGTCSTASCHDNGTGTPAVTPTWGTAVNDCSECHATIPATASHGKHVTTTLYAKALCGDCHDGAVQATNAGTAHLDTNLDVTNGYPANVAKGGAPYDSCAAAYCHSPGQGAAGAALIAGDYASVTWGGAATCGSCHKVTEATGLTSGSHAAHLGTTMGNVTVAGCADCHSGAANDASAYNSTQHVDRTIDVTGGYSQGASHAPANGYGTCSTASCHDNGTGVAGTTPTWGTAVNDCSECHATIPATGSHAKHVTTTLYAKALCGDCHDGAVQATTAPADHLDGNVDVYDVAASDLGYPANKTKGSAYTNCTTAYCHSPGQGVTGAALIAGDYASVAWGGTAACGSCHKVTEAGGLTSGSHAAHLGTTGVNGCADCHSGAANDASTYNGTNHVNRLIDVTGTYTAGGAPGNGYGTCSTASCHDNGTGVAGTTPTWGTAVNDCSECHATIPATGSHAKHVTTTLYAKALCGDCHDGAVQATTAPADHLDGNVDVYDVAASDLGYPANKTKGSAYTNCTTAYCHSTGQSTSNGASAVPTYATVAWGGAAACGSCHKVTEAGGLTSGSHAAHLGTIMGNVTVSGCADCHTGAANDASAYNSIQHIDRTIDVAASYTAGGAPGNGYGTCSTSCHDNGTGVAGMTPTWGTAVNDCSECHARQPATGSHTKHLTGQTISPAIACAACHAGAVEATTAPPQHLDGNLDVYKTAAGDLGYPVDTAKGGAPYNSCSTSYCHSNGKGTFKTVTWGVTSTGCNFCHDNPPASGHPNDIDCSKCHNHVAAADNAFTDITKHINGTVEAQVDSCTTCHGAGAYKDPEAADPDHKSHTSVATFLAGKTISGGGLGGAGWYSVSYDASSKPLMGCGQCHPANLHRDGTVQTDLDPAGETITAPNAKLNNLAGAMFNGTKCSAVYCHSDGITDGSYTDSPNWDATAFNANLTCASCHGNSPTSGTHNWHEVGIHYKTLYDDDGTGLMPAGAAPATDAGAAHGNSTTSDTIGCQTCHNNTVSVEYNAGNTVCGTCHTDTNAPATGNEMAMIKASSTAHLDGAKTVFFASLSGFKSKSQLRNDITTETALNNSWTRTNSYKAATGTSYDAGKNAAPGWDAGAKTCSTVDCHNGITTPNWSAGSSANCLACHTTLPQ
ncbi:MAG: CxxxxCH/CxxCH domain-containing protein [Desulfuromonas sp.]|nr:CxxxxCH/CxxCH domain-containing protein [Desulfuromonas sp.]